MDNICRAYEAVVDDVATDQRTVTAIINTGCVDRYRTVIDPAGIDLEAYRKNPIVLWEHGKDPVRGRMPIGRNLWLKRQGGKLVARTQFARDDYSTALFEMYRDGLLRGWSVFAVPDARKMSPPTREEKRERPELADCEMVFRACELCEYSAVAVPGNPETLTVLAERGIWCPQERMAVVDPRPNPNPRAVEDEDEDEPGPIAESHGEDETRDEDETERPKKPVPAIVQGRLYESISAEMRGEARHIRRELLAHIRDMAALLQGRV